jgi:hypothetical protein
MGQKERGGKVRRDAVYVEAPHIQELVAAGDVTVVGADVARRFSDFLDTLPWTDSGQQVDWSSIPHHDLDLDVFSEGDLVTAVRSTRVRKYERLLVLYRPDESAVHCALDFGVRNVDALYWHAPGARYMCGASWDGAVLIPVFDALVEFNGTNRLRVAA